MPGLKKQELYFKHNIAFLHLILPKQKLWLIFSKYGVRFFYITYATEKLLPNM